ncbi:MAG TPA: hypothetical protein VGI42_04485 [Chthoniobacterales bacterium]|jgi:hypothetical protein
MDRNAKAQPRFYFSLPRLIVKIYGGNPARIENNGTEAWLVGLAVYFISYFFFAAAIVPAGPATWSTAVRLILLVFLIWLFWLVVLYLNALIIKSLRFFGFFRTIPVRRAQSILLGISTTAMACELLGRGSVLRALGIVWLAAVALNLAAALLLNLTHASQSPER